MTSTPLFSSLPSGVFIRSESAKLECEQHEGRLVLFNACSFVAGGPEPHEGGGLGQAQTFMVEVCMGMGFPVGMGFPWDSHGNGNEKHISIGMGVKMRMISVGV